MAQLTLVMLRGLPGSGKTTFAKSMCESRWANMVRVNKDDIRIELGLQYHEETGADWVWSPKNETQVCNLRDKRIAEALASGKNVVSDDTNFAEKHRRRIEAIAKWYDAKVEFHFIDTPLLECIARDALRTGKQHVGEAVIRKMWAQYLAPEFPTFEKYERDYQLLDIVMCDLDGTLALFDDGHRSPYDASKCGDDTVNYPVFECLQAMSFAGFPIVYMSGRGSEYRAETEKWLKDKCAPDGNLYMRPMGDNRKDHVIKGELFDAHIRGQFNVLFVLDDRQRVVDFWRSIGLTVFQVAKGDF